MKHHIAPQEKCCNEINSEIVQLGKYRKTIWQLNRIKTLLWQQISGVRYRLQNALWRKFGSVLTVRRANIEEFSGTKIYFANYS